MILVDGKKVDSNVPVTANSKIQVFTKNGERMPIKESTVWCIELWLENMGLL